MTRRPPRLTYEGDQALLVSYYHSNFFLAAALLAIHTALLFFSGSSASQQPLLLAVDGALGIAALVAAEYERRRPDGGDESARGVPGFLTLMGLLQIALCVLTGGLASPYFVLLACTTVIAAATVPPARALYVTGILAGLYVLGIRLTFEDRIGVIQIDRAERTSADTFTAIAVHVAFLILAPSLTARVASRNRDRVQAIKAQSLRDPLTRLENRRSFLNRMEGQVQRSERYQYPITMLILDLDHFKKLNDEHGHAIGDAVLKEVAALLEDTKGADDYVARIGGEEFAVASVRPEPNHGRELAERIVRAFRGRNWTRIRPNLAVTVSIGVATHQPGRTFEEPTSVIRNVMERADRALYVRKQNGRDGYEVASETPASAGAGA